MKRFFVFAVVIILTCIRPLPVPSAVTLESPLDGTVWHSSVITFHWAETTAFRYLFQIAEDSKFRRVVVEETTTVDSVTVKIQADGQYWWRVKVQSEDSVWGDWSEIWSFTVERFRVIGSIRTRGYPHRLAILEDRGYVAQGQAGLAVFDLGDPGAPRLLGEVMDSLNSAWGVAVQETLAFVAYGYKELMIVNVACPESMKVVGVLEYPQPGFGYDLALRDSWVYIAGGAQFIAVNVSDPRYPNLRFQFYYPRNCRGITIENSRGYLACEQIGVAAWRLDTFPPVQIGGFDTPGNARGVVVKNGILFVADGVNGLVVVDARDPMNMRLSGSLTVEGYANSVALDDTLVLIACGSGGLAVINCARTEEPELIARIKTPYAYAVGVAPDHTHYFVCDRDLGIVTVRKEE